MNADEFAKDPWRFFEDAWDIATIQPYWIEAAWASNEEFRNELTEQFIRSVEKTGMLSLAESEVVIASRGLNPKQISELYSTIRNTADRNEVEWRYDFARKFSSGGEELPEIQESSLSQFDFGTAFLVSMDEADIDRIHFLIECVRLLGKDLSEVKIVDLGILGLDYEKIATMDEEQLDRLVEETPDSTWPSVVECAQSHSNAQVRNAILLK